MPLMLDRLTRGVSGLPFKRPASIVAIAAVLTIFSAFGSAHFLRWNANPDELANQSSQYLRDHQKFEEEFGNLDCIFVVVEAGKDPARVRRCVDRLEEELKKIPELAGVHASIGPKEQLRLASRAMPIEDLQHLVEASAALPALVSGEGPGRVLDDAVGMFGELTEKNLFMPEQRQKELGTAALCLLTSLAAGLEDSPARASLRLLKRGEEDRQYLQTQNGSLYFLRLLAKPEFQGLDVVHVAIEKIRAIISRIEGEYTDLKIGLTGKQVLLSDQMQIGSRDMTVATIISTVLVWLLIMAALRAVLPPMFAMLSLAMGISITFGLTTLAVGELTLLSACFTPVLVGIGIDYGIHLLMRYQEERRGLSAEHALAHAHRAVTPGNLIGAATTCVAFFSAMLTGSPGFSQLGFISGTGVLLCMLAMTLVLPSIVIIHERWFGKLQAKRNVTSVALPLPPRAWAWPLITAFGIVTVAAITLIPRVSFNDNVLELQPPDLPSVRWERRVLADGDSTIFGAIMASDIPSVAHVVDELRQHASVGAIHSILDAIPVPTPEREELRAALTRSNHGPTGKPQVEYTPYDLESMSRALLAFEVFARGRSPKHADLMRQLSKDLKTLAIRLRSPDPAVVRETRASISRSVQDVGDSLATIYAGNRASLREALPETVRSMLISPGGRFLVMAHPAENVWDFHNLDRFVADLHSVDPHATGFPVIHFGTVNDLKRSFFLASAVALVAVAGVVWLDSRKLSKTLLSMVPLAISLIWTLGWMGLSGHHFNLVNFISIPILIGIGVDNGVHIVHRFKQPAGDVFDIGSTGLAVTMTSITNMAGFGSLLISSHRGAQSLGLIMLVGCALTTLASTLLLPAIMMCTGRASVRAHHKVAREIRPEAA